MKILPLLAAAAFAVACDAPTSPRTIASIAPVNTAAKAVLSNERRELITFAEDDCNGNVIVVDLTVHDVVALTLDGAGGALLKEHGNVVGQGFAPATGVNYVVNQTFNYELNFSVGVETTTTRHYNLIAKGNEPNENMVMDYHATVTPDGDVTSFHDNARIECQ